MHTVGLTEVDCLSLGALARESSRIGLILRGRDVESSDAVRRACSASERMGRGRDFADSLA
jgi:hypothetical protein